MADIPRVAVGVVVYHPDAGLLRALVEAVIATVDAVALFCNSPLTDPAVLQLVRDHPGRVQVLGDGSNIGLGAAYNAMCAWAVTRQCDRILLFDQDSSPSPALALALGRHMDRLVAAGERPAVVGPRASSSDGTRFKAPRVIRAGPAGFAGGTGGIDRVGFVISSGSLIDIAAFRVAGPFRADFFIDAIDIEWCLRAGSAGYSCWMATDQPMAHRLGAGVIRIPLIDVHLVRQPPGRITTFIRNQLAMFRPAHIPLAWKARAALMLTVHSIAQVIASRQKRAMLMQSGAAGRTACGDGWGRREPVCARPPTAFKPIAIVRSGAHRWHTPICRACAAMAPWRPAS